jgi:hypothetical protein
MFTVAGVAGFNAGLTAAAGPELESPILGAVAGAVMAGLGDGGGDTVAAAGLRPEAPLSSGTSRSGKVLVEGPESAVPVGFGFGGWAAAAGIGGGASAGRGALMEAGALGFGAVAAGIGTGLGFGAVAAGI